MGSMEAPKESPVKQIENSTGKRKLTPSVTKANIKKIPNAPASLGEDGKRVWNVIFNAASKYVDVTIDVLQAEILCQLWDETEFMRKQLSLGSIGGGVDRREYTNNGKTLVRHVYVQDVKDNRVLMNQIFREFGFTPAARARLNFESDVETQVYSAINDLRQTQGRLTELEKKVEYYD